jgi:hypothetical protein
MAAAPGFRGQREPYVSERKTVKNQQIAGYQHLTALHLTALRVAGPALR